MIPEQEEFFDSIDRAYKNGFADGYDKGRADVINKIYSYVKRECNPYGKPTIDFESGKKILNYLKQLKEKKND